MSVSLSDTLSMEKRTTFKNYYELTKPRVVLLMILTTIVGMCLAAPGMIAWHVLLLGNIGIAFGAGAAAVVNHIVDQRIDGLMKRTERRPIVQGKVTTMQALTFAFALCFVSMFLLVAFVNVLVAVLTFITLIGYAVLYTMYLKRATAQNIVIGGIAGAAPPLLGWVAVTGQISPQPLLLVLIIFVWTPPHFWALAIARVDEYAKAKIPMLPNTRGVPFTKLNVWLYTILLCAVTLLPYAIGMCGLIYLVSVFLLNMRFLYWAWRLKLSENARVPMLMFRYSIVYLMLLFLALLVDHYLIYRPLI